MARRRRAPRIQEHFKGRAERAIAGRHVFRYLAGATLVLSVAAGVLVWIIDRRDFATLGDGLWWALQTLSTVGYGDVVPQSAWGRVLGAVVIILGVTFLSFLTATITSYFVSADQDERAADVEALRGADQDDTQALLRDVLQRLESIEQALRDGPTDGTSR
jgi:voltage-gated potassium channel